MKIADQLSNHIKARYPLLLLETHEEDRAIEIIEGVAKDQSKPLYVWTSTRGIALRGAARPIPDTRDAIVAIEYVQSRARPQERGEQGESAIYVFLDFHAYMDPLQNPEVIRVLRDAYSVLKDSFVSIVFVSPAMKIPEELKKSITILDLPLPGVDELGQIYEDSREVHEKFHPGDNLFEGIGKDEICTAGLGLTLDEFENAVSKCIVERDFSVAAITREKSQIIRKGGLLECYDPSDGIGDVGGLANLKAWLLKTKLGFSPEAERYGLEQPKFILLYGPPGTGKSLMAKVIAKYLDLPLFRFDMANLTTSRYGETASNVKGALKLASAPAPDVLWFDEFEKMFASGQGGGDRGHEETNRARAVVLTDYEENPAKIFRIATCNSRAGLPPEFMSRFEKIFFVDLPNPAERREIFAIHLRKFGWNPSDFELERLVHETPGFVGREIRVMIKEAMRDSFCDGARPLTTEDILAVKAHMKPVSIQMKAEIDENRAWAQDNATPASSTPDTTQKRARIIEV